MNKPIILEKIEREDKIKFLQDTRLKLNDDMLFRTFVDEILPINEGERLVQRAHQKKLEILKDTAKRIKRKQVLSDLVLTIKQDEAKMRSVENALREIKQVIVREHIRLKPIKKRINNE